MRGPKCKYRHADNVEINPREPPNSKVIFCRNYQRGKCNLPNCKYLHLSRADEEFYFQTGALPSHDNNYNTPFIHNFQTQSNGTEQTSTLASLAAKPFQPSNPLPPLNGTSQSTPLDNLSSIPIPNEQPLQDSLFKQSSPKSDSPFSPPSESSLPEKSKTPPQKSLSHSSQSISEYIGGKSDTTRTRRWSIDNTDQPDEMTPHKLSPLSLTPRDEAFKNPEVDLMKIKLHQMEEKVKSLEFYNDILREQNMQLKQQVKRYENPFSPIYKPIIQEDNDVSISN